MRELAQRNGPWLALILAGAAYEKWALKNDQEATLTRFARRTLRCRTTVGKLGTGFLFGWLWRHLTETDKSD